MNRLALIGIIVSNKQSVEQLNHLLSENGSYIRARMGVPCPDRGVSVISVLIDAPANVTSALSGKLGMLDGVSIKTIYQKEETK